MKARASPNLDLNPVLGLRLKLGFSPSSSLGTSFSGSFSVSLSARGNGSLSESAQVRILQYNILINARYYLGGRNRQMVVSASSNYGKRNFGLNNYTIIGC